MTRTSYKSMSVYAGYFNLEVIKHQRLGKTDYYYEYSVVKADTRERVLDITSLKGVKEYLYSLDIDSIK